MAQVFDASSPEIESQFYGGSGFVTSKPLDPEYVSVYSGNGGPIQTLLGQQQQTSFDQQQQTSFDQQQQTSFDQQQSSSFSQQQSTSLDPRTLGQQSFLVQQTPLDHHTESVNHEFHSYGPAYFLNDDEGDLKFEARLKVIERVPVIKDKEDTRHTEQVSWETQLVKVTKSVINYFEEDRPEDVPVVDYLNKTKLKIYYHVQEEEKEVPVKEKKLFYEERSEILQEPRLVAEDYEVMVRVPYLKKVQHSKIGRSKTGNYRGSLVEEYDYPGNFNFNLDLSDTSNNIPSLGKVETVLSSSPYVDNVILHLDPMHDNCVALIVAKHAALEDWAKTAGVGYSDFADLCSKPEARQEVLTSLDKVARERNLERFEIPTEVRLLADPGDLVSATIMLREQASMTKPEGGRYRSSEGGGWGGWVSDPPPVGVIAAISSNQSRP